MPHSVEVADIFRAQGAAWREAHAGHLSLGQLKVMSAIERCRSAELGGHVLCCKNCAQLQIAYNSCRNRHCPQCQKAASVEWLERRRADLLPVPYFHLVFTLPHEFNGWVQLHPEVIYRLMFKAVSHTLKTFGRDPKRLDGELGMTLVLHTWGQNLSQHVHLHCLIPGGALADGGEGWHPARSNYLFPVKALSRCYRGHMVRLLRQAWNRQLLNRIRDPEQVDDTLDDVMRKPWVVFAKPTSEHTDHVLTYLSRYTYRIAISDRRLVSMDEHRVFFRWKNYRTGGQQQTMSLTGEEFIRRWLLHVLPHGLMRIRHYGFLANCHRRTKLAQIRHCLTSSVVIETAESVERPLVTHPAVPQASYCPKCHEACLRVIGEIDPRRRRPTG